MSNDNPLPSGGPIAVDPSQAQVLLASNIAADDLLWVVRTSVEELHKLFQAPVEWVASLASLPGWVDAVTREPVPAAVLTADFGMSLESSDRLDPDGWAVVQGIGGTNQLTVVASRASAIRSLLATDKVAEAVAKTLGRSLPEAKSLSDAELLRAGWDPFGPFWDLVSRSSGDPTQKKTLIVDIILDISRFYAHFEILDRGETLEERAKRTCSFLFASVFDPKGEAEMYNGLDQETLEVKGDQGAEGARMIVLPAVDPRGFYANIEGGKPDIEARDEDPNAECICYSFNGVYYPPSWTGGSGEGAPQGGMLKRWGVECS
jgi:hypothetical protein